MTKKMAQFLGYIIGTVEEVDVGASGYCPGKFMRVRIQFNATELLKRIIMVYPEEVGDDIMILL